MSTWHLGQSSENPLVILIFDFPEYYPTHLGKLLRTTCRSTSFLLFGQRHRLELTTFFGPVAIPSRMCSDSTTSPNSKNPLWQLRPSARASPGKPLVLLSVKSGCTRTHPCWNSTSGKPCRPWQPRTCKKRTAQSTQKIRDDKHPNLRGRWRSQEETLSDGWVTRLDLENPQMTRLCTCMWSWVDMHPLSTWNGSKKTETEHGEQRFFKAHLWVSPSRLFTRQNLLKIASCDVVQHADSGRLHTTRTTLQGLRLSLCGTSHTKTLATQHRNGTGNVSFITTPNDRHVKMAAFSQSLMIQHDIYWAISAQRPGRARFNADNLTVHCSTVILTNNLSTNTARQLFSLTSRFKCTCMHELPCWATSLVCTLQSVTAYDKLWKRQPQRTTGDPRSFLPDALRKLGKGTMRIAALWSPHSTYKLDMNIAKCHRAHSKAKNRIPPLLLSFNKKRFVFCWVCTIFSSWISGSSIKVIVHSHLQSQRRNQCADKFCLRIRNTVTWTTFDNESSQRCHTKMHNFGMCACLLKMWYRTQKCASHGKITWTSSVSWIRNWMSGGSNVPLCSCWSKECFTKWMICSRGSACATTCGIHGHVAQIVKESGWQIVEHNGTNSPPQSIWVTVKCAILAIEPNGSPTSQWCTSADLSWCSAWWASCCEDKSMPFMCESEMSEMNVRLFRCIMWKAHHNVVNGTAERLCQITFLSEVTKLKAALKCAVETNRNSCYCEYAVHECAEKHACGEVFIYTPPSSSPHKPWSTRWTSVSGRAFLSEYLKKKLFLLPSCWWWWWRDIQEKSCEHESVVTRQCRHWLFGTPGWPLDAYGLPVRRMEVSSPRSAG